MQVSISAVHVDLLNKLNVFRVMVTDLDTKIDL